MSNHLDEMDQSHTSPPVTVPEPVTEPESIMTREAAAELRRRYSNLSALYVASTRLSAILDWDRLTERLLEISIQVVRADGASLMIVDEQHCDLYIEATANLTGAGTHSRVKIGESIAGWVAEHREAVLLVDDSDLSRFRKLHPRPDVIGSAISVPLIPPPVAGQLQNVIGVLNIHREPQSPALTRDDLEVIAALGTQAATALQNARLYKQLQRSNTQLENLIDIGRNLTQTLQIDIVLRSIMQKAVELLHCQAGSLLLVEPASGELTFRIALGPAGARLSNTHLPAGIGIAGAVVQSGKPLISNDALSDPRHYASLDDTTLVTRSLLCVPLVNKGHIIGALEVINKTDGTPFDENDRDSLVAFAIQSSIGLENARLYSDLKRAFTDTVKVIANAVEARDPYTAGHSERVSQAAIRTALELGWTQERVDLLEIGSLLHDIGKIGIGDAILRKPTHLTEDEYAEMKKHPILGAKMLESVGVLRAALPYILYHHERFDGKGYPFGLVGFEIPAEGRLLAVVDTLDAMTSDRPYRKGLSIDQALEEIKRNRGTQFDPDVVDALLRVAHKGTFEQLLMSGHPLPVDAPPV